MLADGISSVYTIYLLDEDGLKGREMNSVDDVRGVGPTLAASLRAHGIKTVEALAKTTHAALMQVPGIGTARASALIASAREMSAGAKTGQKTTTPAKRPTPAVRKSPRTRSNPSPKRLAAATTKTPETAAPNSENKNLPVTEDKVAVKEISPEEGEVQKAKTKKKAKAKSKAEKAAKQAAKLERKFSKAKEKVKAKAKAKKEKSKKDKAGKVKKSEKKAKSEKTKKSDGKTKKGDSDNSKGKKKSSKSKT
jgi:Helix-hairpin-helix domain